MTVKELLEILNNVPSDYTVTMLDDLGFEFDLNKNLVNVYTFDNSVVIG